MQLKLWTTKINIESSTTAEVMPPAHLFSALATVCEKGKVLASNGIDISGFLFYINKTTKVYIAERKFIIFFVVFSLFLSFTSLFLVS